MPGMTTVPLQDLFAQGVSSKVSVQPCPQAHPASVSVPAATTAPASSVAGTQPAAPKSP